ncbi:putative heat shock 70 kda protein 12a protein [Eutypa lata UCREL1]|uniref:Putative heat shock 70 kDa protein 12a protein n=1 Tax=Eutypa lata (strain UCR-EL1) TaxID=1287681 RepID=M7SD03_EUTLA|nr:putative heat shock 70 kda protein 12a protein [Eutypa lata UCREL1]
MKTANACRRVAYAFTNDHEKIYTVDTWPGADDRIVPKTPTTLQYEHDSITKFKWGYQLDQSNEEKIVGLKLLLDPDQNCPYQIPADTQTEIEQLPKPVVEIASDYIRSIFQHALKEIEKGYFPGFINGFKKQYILTVPAVWSDPAKALTERHQAARNAGISPVDMITEPEAAALYTLQTMKDKGLKDGDAIIICDAGGGTVDLISYEIVSQSPFHVKALTIPSGGAHGSLMLNKSFEKEVRNIVGEDAFGTLKKTPGYQGAMREFDLVHKLSFRGPGDADRYVSFPMANLADNKAKGLMKNSITLSGQTMFRIFDPIIKEIDKLVSDQVKDGTHSGRSGVKAIFLVGGFGASEFLKERIQASNPGIMVIQPKEA